MGSAMMTARVPFRDRYPASSKLVGEWVVLADYPAPANYTGPGPRGVRLARSGETPVGAIIEVVNEAEVVVVHATGGPLLIEGRSLVSGAPYSIMIPGLPGRWRDVPFRESTEGRAFDNQRRALLDEIGSLMPSGLWPMWLYHRNCPSAMLPAFKGTADIPPSKSVEAAIAESACNIEDYDEKQADEEMLDDLLDWCEWKEDQ